MIDPPKINIPDPSLALMTAIASTAIFNNGLSYKALISVFDQCFLTSHNTLLQGGHDEPLYLPAEKFTPARIFFRENFASSALHEISHWCIAGEQRRQEVDFGYWYEPDGRTSEQQVEFQKVEIKPQALEWLFSIAAGIQFRISLDNLNGEMGSYDEFENAVAAQAQIYLQVGLPDRAAQFYEALLICGAGRKAVLTDFA